jgi:hypothetical protein
MMCCRWDDVLACRLQVNSTCAHHTTVAAGCMNMGRFSTQREAVSSDKEKNVDISDAVFARNTKAEVEKGNIQKMNHHLYLYKHHIAITIDIFHLNNPSNNTILLNYLFR